MNHKNSNRDFSTEEAISAGGIPVSKLEMAPQSTPLAPSLPPEDSSGGSGFLPTEMSEPERFERIQNELKNLGVCLGIQVTPLEKNEEFNVGTFTAAIQNELGEVVLIEDEWHATDIQTPSGELRRILVRHDNLEGGGRSLRYIAYRNDQEVDLELTPEQTKNPSETFIASLEKDGKLISKASALRAIFAGGASAAIGEKDGQIHSFQIPHKEKTFQCTGADGVNLTCTCSEKP